MQPNEEDRFDTHRLFKSVQVCLAGCPPAENALLKLASTSWGYDHHTLCATCITTGRSKVEYGTSSWLPWVLNSTMENLEITTLHGMIHWITGVANGRPYVCKHDSAPCHTSGKNKKSLVILNPPQHPHLSTHSHTPALTPLS